MPLFLLVQADGKLKPHYQKGPVSPFAEDFGGNRYKLLAVSEDMAFAVYQPDKVTPVTVTKVNT